MWNKHSGVVTKIPIIMKSTKNVTSLSPAWESDGLGEPKPWIVSFSSHFFLSLVSVTVILSVAQLRDFGCYLGFYPTISILMSSIRKFPPSGNFWAPFPTGMKEPNSSRHIVSRSLINGDSLFWFLSPLLYLWPPSPPTCTIPSTLPRPLPP